MFEFSMENRSWRLSLVLCSLEWSRLLRQICDTRNQSKEKDHHIVFQHCFPLPTKLQFNLAVANVEWSRFWFCFSLIFFQFLQPSQDIRANVAQNPVSVFVQWTMSTLVSEFSDSSDEGKYWRMACITITIKNMRFER